MYMFCTIDLHELNLRSPAGRPASKKAGTTCKNIHSTLVSTFCTIDLHEMDLCLPADRPEKRRDELETHTFNTRVYVLYNRPA
jgi:hypothetical protein